MSQRPCLSLEVNLDPEQLAQGSPELSTQGCTPKAHPAFNPGPENSPRLACCAEAARRGCLSSLFPCLLPALWETTRGFGMSQDLGLGAWPAEGSSSVMAPYETKLSLTAQDRGRLPGRACGFVSDSRCGPGHLVALLLGLPAYKIGARLASLTGEQQDHVN